MFTKLNYANVRNLFEYKMSNVLFILLFCEGKKQIKYRCSSEISKDKIILQELQVMAIFFILFNNNEVYRNSFLNVHFSTILF